MANNPHVDLSYEIGDFRRALSWALTQKLYDLEKETDRIEQILKDKQAKPALSFESPIPQSQESASSNDVLVVGHIDLKQFDPSKAKRRERIKGGSSIPAPSIYLSSKEAAVVFPERKALVESFLKLAAEDVGYVRDCFLLRSTLQYAVIRKEITDLNCDYYVIRLYTGKLPSSNEIAAFLVDAYISEENLTRDLLTTLAKRYDVFPLLDALCDNPFLRGKNPDLTLAKKAISEAIAGLGGGQMDFRKDMSAIMIALDNRVLRDLGSYILAAKKVTWSDLSRKEFPLNEDQVEMLQFGEGEFSTYPEGKDEYLKALNGVLDEAEKKGYFTQNELSVIGDNAHRSTSVDIELYTEPNDEDVAEFFLGLKNSLKSMAKIRKIAMILTEMDCIKSEYTPLLVYRLSGNCRPENFDTTDTILWEPKDSKAPRDKPGTHRHPYELYYLLHHMYEESPVMYAEKVFKFFDFDNETKEKVTSALDPKTKSGIAQLERMANKDFKERLHAVDGSVFPLPE